MTLGSAALLWGLTLTGASSPPPASPADSIVGPGDRVPFLAQGPLLCGGAAAAMLERFWGARGRYASDYARLVHADEGGIRTSDLAAEIEGRGYEVTVLGDDPEPTLAALAHGIPAIILLDGGATALHYVVLVAVSDTEAWLHDPNFGPSRRLARSDLLERWARSGYWALLATPQEGAEEVAAEPPSVRRDAAPSDASNDSAMVLLRAGDPAAAADEARRVSADGRGGPTARRILATALYLDGHTDDALDVWNELHEPVVDLVVVRGSGPVRFQAIASDLGVRPREILTARSLGTARRRLRALPAVNAGRVDYHPQTDGTVEVEAALARHERWPGPITLTLQSGRAIVTHQAELSVGPFFSFGDRWTVGSRWDGAQRSASGVFQAPAPWALGVAEVGAEWRHERYAPTSTIGPIGEEERVAGWVDAKRWLGPSLRVGATLGLERSSDVRYGSLAVGADQVLGDDAIVLSATVTGLAGADRTFGRVEASLDAERSDRVSRAWRLRAGVIATTPSAPRLLWPGAGAGRIRDPLLRAHPLVHDGLIDGVAFGPRLTHATLEHRRFLRVGPFVAGALAFVDGAVVWRTDGAGDPAGPAHAWVDVGLGGFAEISERRAIVSLARGEGSWVLSAQVEHTR